MTVTALECRGSVSRILAQKGGTEGFKLRCEFCLKDESEGPGTTETETCGASK